MDRETEGNLGKGELFENSTYLFHFNRLVPYHHTKYKEKLNFINKNTQINRYSALGLKLNQNI